MDALIEGDFLARTENVLAFGNPGSGKTHLLCALGHELILKGRRIYFTPCALLVQRLLRAKAELGLEKKLKVHRLKAMGSGDTNMLGRLKPAFAVAQTAAFRRRPFGGSGPFGTS